MSRIAPSTSANTLTPAYSTVSSPGGFQSGDLVYYKDSSFGTIPGNAVSTANFPVSANVSQNQTAFNATVNWANYNPNTYIGSTTSRAPSVATLSNGNIVVVFSEATAGGSGAACFKIINQDGAVVVDRTALGVSSSGFMGVCALTGGGFAVAVRNVNVSQQLNYGVFSNTGAVVFALTTDANFGSNSSTEIRALSGGGFVIGAFVSSSTYGFRTYSSTGVANAFVSNSGLNSNTQVVITTFSDNTFAALYPSGTTTLQVTRFNNTGGVVGTSTVSTDWYTQSGYDFITLSDGSGVILNIDNDSGQYNMYARSYNQSSGVVSARTQIAGLGNYQINVNAFALPGGQFIATDSISNNGSLVLRRYNSSFAPQSVMNLYSFAGYVTNAQSQIGSRITIIEGPTYLTLVSNSYTRTSPSYGSMPYIQIDKSNITDAGIRHRFVTSQTVASLPASVSGYARSASTPNAASFLAANTQTLTQTFTQSSGSNFALTPYVAITDNNVTMQCMTKMTNGDFVISYRLGTGASRFSVFNASGVLLNTYTVAAVGTSAGITQCTCLGNGKLVVSWVPGTNDRVNFSVYAAGTYSLLATGSTNGTATGGSFQSPASWNSAAGHDIAPFGDAFFVVGYADGSGAPSLAVFNDSAVYQSHVAGSNLGGIWNIRLASNASGMVALKHFSSSQGQGYCQWFFRNATNNTVYFQTTNALSGYNTNNFGEGAAMSPYGNVFGFGINGASRLINRQAISGQYSLTLSSQNSNSAGVCIGQDGDFIFINIDSGSASWNRASLTANLTVYGTSISQSLTETQSITVSNPNTNTNIGSYAQIVNLYDNIYAFSYINGGNTSSGGQIVVGMICTTATNYSANITAGVTPSSTALVPSPANGYYLAGVSASECPAGGTGVLQINGAATLNSQYPAGTTSQSFDFNTPALDVGVRGTIAGRNVILSGGK